MQTSPNLNPSRVLESNLVVDAIKTTLPTETSSNLCIFDQIYTAGCYTNLSYALSKLHSESIESIKHEDTLLLFQKHKDITLEVYDDAQHPNAGAIIIPTPSEVILAFHGINFTQKSAHITNFETSLQKSHLLPGAYHAGFLRISSAIIPKIIHVLEQQLGSLNQIKQKFRIYGHSMGAGLAQYLTQYLQHRYDHLDIQTIVFGSPKIMCPIAAKAYNDRNKNRTMRVENPLDLAIYMPTQFMGYDVVNNSVLLPNTHSDLQRNHCIEGYLESIQVLRQQFRTQGIQAVSLEHYLAATSRLNSIHPWMPYSSTGQSTKSSIGEFIHFMGHGINKGIQSLIRLIPFKE
jgi:hypothetical protein